MNTRSEQILKLIDEGVPIIIALNSFGISEERLPEKTMELLKQRAAQAQARMLQALYQTTQRASANPSAIASAAQAWIKLTENKGATQKQNISIEIEGESDA